MTHKSQRPTPAKEPHAKSEVSICSILESPLHCWPLTMFYSDKVDHEKQNGKEIVKKKLTKVTLSLILLILAVAIHSITFNF